MNFSLSLSVVTILSLLSLYAVQVTSITLTSSHDLKPTEDNNIQNSSISNSTTTERPLEEKDEGGNATNHLILQISSGQIKGRELLLGGSNQIYYAFQGIPYAKPPVNDLRFREPLPIEKWNGTLKAAQEAPRCVYSSSVAGSEDCLYLNVFSPEIRKECNQTLLPVMVWIHEDIFSTENSPKLESFYPDYFISEGVVIVTLSYRVGIFGFLSTEDYSAPGNWGLKDQILALKWVQENIQNFGGDHNNVTLFGQGAGSSYISILIQSPLAKGLFHRAILQSGTSLNQWAYSQNPRKAAFGVARLLDIHTDQSRELVDHLRKVDYRTLYVVSVSTDFRETIFHNPLDGLAFAPNTEVPHPGAVISNHSHSILKDGEFNGVPVIVGFNSQEALGSINVINYLIPYLAKYDLFSTKLVPKSLNIKRYLIKIIVAQLIRIKYFGWKPMILSNNQLVQFVTDDQFARPIYEFARQYSKYSPIYFYIFSHEGPLGVDGKHRLSSGVAHGEEINYLWKRESNINNAPNEDILTRKRLLRLWSNFAKTGNPTPIQEELLQNITWPLANVKSMTFLNISTKLEIDSNVERYSIQFWDEIFSRNGNPPYDTY
ncbi:carboxylesterase 4A-like [Euwallacea similis]|uniref:carboxylesterase 4A-like n=1 Tax=Euwallacea similis TaxID=1736056 RepID=UPI00344E5610